MVRHSLLVPQLEINVITFDKYCISDGPIADCLVRPELCNFKAATAMPLEGNGTTYMKPVPNFNVIFTISPVFSVTK
jgi:hypothetical protein